MVNCSIRNCKNRSVKGGSVRFFSFPRDERMAKAWLQLCKPTSTAKHGKVCSVHFLPTDYHRPLRHILMNENPIKFRVLKPEAIPSLNINETDNASSSTQQTSFALEISPAALDATSDFIMTDDTCKTECPDDPTRKSKSCSIQTEKIDTCTVPTQTIDLSSISHVSATDPYSKYNVIYSVPTPTGRVYARTNTMRYNIIKIKTNA